MITAGTISYGETRKIADYENKTAKVELSFSVEDGEDYDAVIESVMALAKAKFHSMMADAAGRAETDEVAVPKRPVGRPRTIKVELHPKGPTVHNEFTPPAAVEQREAIAEAAKVEAAPVVEVKPEPAPAMMIPDTQVTDAVKETHSRIKDAQRIKETAAKYGVPKGGHIANMPQEGRAAFIAELQSLTAKAA